MSNIFFLFAVSHTPHVILVKTGIQLMNYKVNKSNTL